jgi:circadian clock protein KaiA
LEQNQPFLAIISSLQQAELLLPTIILWRQSENRSPLSTDESGKPKSLLPPCYHAGEIVLENHELLTLTEIIPLAINRFLSFSSPEQRSVATSAAHLDSQKPDTTAPIGKKQGLLAEKLKERLGYLGVYYKRNPQRFLRNLSASEAQKLLAQLQILYQNIVFGYFLKDTSVNQEIDEFVNLAFFADLSVTRVVEIHMNLMDEFSKQLQLEGRSEEILLDYRLTLIDVIAHLCEMYRRSVPRES